jgi:aspartate dehydrogenase
MSKLVPNQPIKRSIGIIGYGFIGQAIAQRLHKHDDQLNISFVHARRREQASDISDALFLDDLSLAKSRNADIIVETAHPSITIKHGTSFLSHADYMPLSTSALINGALHNALLECADKSGTRLLLAAGALIGGEELTKRSLPWDRVRITFRKHPKNIDFSDVDVRASDIAGVTTVFDGSVAEIAAKFPRNVNTMVTAALLSTGVEKCEGALIADPSLDCAVAEVEAWGSDGSYIRTEKRQPAQGVSGTEMIDSVWHSIVQASGVSSETQQLV